MEVKENLNKLIAAIKNSKEYQEYCTVKGEVEKDPEKKRRLNRYRTKIYDIQNESSPGDLYRRMDEIEAETEKFREDPVIDRFLESELALCRVVQEINWTLIEELNFDIEFVRDR
ncbi:MAG: YlbF family regulator [Lachnospiraceae bacterium]|nr:YlbF family regulator [Lachnospiraceae bacterium]